MAKQADRESDRESDRERERGEGRKSGRETEGPLEADDFEESACVTVDTTKRATKRRRTTGRASGVRGAIESEKWEVSTRCKRERERRAEKERETERTARTGERRWSTSARSIVNRHKRGTAFSRPASNSTSRPLVSVAAELARASELVKRRE